MRIVILAAVLFLANCATSHANWHNGYLTPNTAYKQFNEDRDECLAEAHANSYTSTVGNTTTPYMGYNLFQFDMCMKSRGWTYEIERDKP